MTLLRIRKSRILGLVAVLAFMAAACATGSDTAETTSAPASTTTVPATLSAATQSAVTVPVAVQDTTPDWAQLALSVVEIWTADLSKKLGSGTLVLDGSHVLTNAHVVVDDWGRDYPYIDVWFTKSFDKETSIWAPVEIVHVDFGLDLALLQMIDVPVDYETENPTEAKGKSIQINDSEMVPGEEITILGYPDNDFTMTLTKGIYAGTTENSYGNPLIKTGVEINPGISGGAAFNKAGEYIGVPTATQFGEERWLVPASSVLIFLAEAQTSPQLPYEQVPQDHTAITDAVSPEDEESLWDRLALSVVEIRDAEGFPLGSGTLVLDGTFVLTNAHVVVDEWGRHMPNLQVWFTNSIEEETSIWAPVEIVDRDYDLDLAVLHLTQSPVDYETEEPTEINGVGIQIRQQHLEPGEEITILGYPEDGDYTMTLTNGVYSGTTENEYGIPLIKTDADVAPGNSGGAAFDQDGNFVGVPTSVTNEVGHLVPAAIAAQFLEDLLFHLYD